jgi:hypothetical protein
MKKLSLSIALFALSFSLFSQEVVTTNQKASEMYVKAKSWIALNFKSANDVIQADIPNEKIIAKGISKNYLTSKYGNQIINIPYDMGIIVTFDIKEGKYRYNVQTTESLAEVPTEGRAEAMVDSIIKVTPGGGLIGKKTREAMKLNMTDLQLQKNNIISKEIEITSLSIKEYMLKKDNW